MTVEEAIIEAQKRGLVLSSLRQAEDGLWIACLTLRNGHRYLDRDETAAGSIMKTAERFPRLVTHQ